MLLNKQTLDAIASGDVSLAFRSWLRQTVKTGGTLVTSIGVLAIGEVTTVEADRITDEDAGRAGLVSADALCAELEKHPNGAIYRIEVALAGPDPRIALRSRETLDPAELQTLRERLCRLDGTAPWTERPLRLIAENPGKRAASLTERFQHDKAQLKLDVRKLKKLGLTESLETGYRISSRGRALLASLG